MRILLLAFFVLASNVLWSQHKPVLENLRIEFDTLVKGKKQRLVFEGISDTCKPQKFHVLFDFNDDNRYQSAQIFVEEFIHQKSRIVGDSTIQTFSDTAWVQKEVYWSLPAKSLKQKDNDFEVKYRTAYNYSSPLYGKLAFRFVILLIPKNSNNPMKVLAKEFQMPQ